MGRKRPFQGCHNTPSTRSSATVDVLVDHTIPMSAPSRTGQDVVGAEPETAKPSMSKSSFRASDR
eukprot:6423068-Prorocentrum_lima.AAC.1